MTKELGAIYTPEGYAQILSKWAIHSKTDLVLDMGIGPGIFVYQAYNRLLELGTNSDEACQQIFGTEIDATVYEKFVNESKNKGMEFANLKNADFFDVSFPQVDAVIGNPPYVRRRGMKVEKLEQIRAKTFAINKALEKKQIPFLSDLYIYFLLYALPFLKVGGRLSALVADSWLNTKYGIVIKEYLQNNFELNQIISFDRSIFDDAQVKTLMILATKTIEKRKYLVSFARVRNGMVIEDLSSYVIDKKVISEKDIVVREIESHTLTPELPWSSICKSTQLFEEVTRKQKVCLIRDIADTQIGLEPLAKDFFVISEYEKGIVEEKYLFPFAYSVCDFNSPIIRTTDDPHQYLFYCSDPKSELVNTKALDYILQGETKEVSVRGTARTVIGYQNKERIQKAKRPNWYDVRTEWERKPIAEILLPRFIYKEYKVLWNSAKYIPGGATIQFFPKRDIFSYANDTEIYLAILSSSFTEIAFRINAQVYGGGTSNMKVSAIGSAPTINVSTLSPEQISRLVAAYKVFVKSNDKTMIDKTIYEILSLSSDQIIEMGNLLFELRHILEVAKKAAHQKD